MRRLFLVGCLWGASCAPSPTTEPGSQSGQLITHGEAIVGFSSGALPSLAIGDSLLGYVIVQVVEAGDFVVVEASDLGALRAALAPVPNVDYIEDNSLVHSTVTPNDSRYVDQYGPAMMGFPAAWDVTFGSADVTVAIIDSGIYAGHADFDADLLLPGYDYVRGDGVPNDECGHGTHVAGTVGAWTDNGMGVAGMAQVGIMPMKALFPYGAGCSGYLSDVAEAIYDARDAGADIVSMSIGTTSDTTTLRNAVNAAWTDGVVLVASAGNDYGGAVNYPAAYSSVIAVSALDSDRTIASYSSIGSQVEVAAPGTDVLSTLYNGGYGYKSGTSMAAPHVAGTLALLKSCAPHLTAQQVRNALAASAEDLGAAGRDSQYGHGLARADWLVDAHCTLPPPSDGSEPLDNGQVHTVSVPEGEERLFHVLVPEDATSLSIEMDNPSCLLILLLCRTDVDVYVRQGRPPTDTEYDCRPGRYAQDETCDFSNPTRGYWYVRLVGQMGSEPVDLVATHNGSD